MDHPDKAFVAFGVGKQLDSDGLPSRNLCPFQPESKEYYIELIEEISRWPATREIHLNDEASLGLGDKSVGCYCKYCMAEFESYSGSKPPVTVDWDSPLWWEWIEYRMDIWVAIHLEFREKIKNINPQIVVGIQHNPLHATFSQKPWVTAVSLARDAKAMDMLAVDPYHFIHCNHIPYRPHRRILAEGTRSLVGACVDREAEIYPQGFSPPGKSAPLTRHDGLMAGAIPFAMGADTVTPYAYELCKIIPGYMEGFVNARRLMPEMEKSKAYSFVTILKPHQSEIRGHMETDWGRCICNILRM